MASEEEESLCVSFSYSYTNKYNGCKDYLNPPNVSAVDKRPIVLYPFNVKKEGKKVC